MSGRYVSQRFSLNSRGQHPVTSYQEERNLTRSHRSSPNFFRHETDYQYPEDRDYSKNPRERRHISDTHNMERPFSPRDRTYFSERRSQEPDLREYLISSHLNNRKLSDFEREVPNYYRTYKDYEMVNQNSDWKYNRNLDIRMDQESLDLRDRELLSRRDYRDGKYSVDSERNRRFSELRDEHYDSRRDRYSSDHRNEVYLPEPRREDHFGFRESVYLADSRREKISPDFRDEAHLSNLRRGWPSPNGRHQEPIDSTRWDQNYRGEFLTDSNRLRQNMDEIGGREFERERGVREFERDGRPPDQSHQNYVFESQRDLRSSDPRYQDPLAEPWRDRYPAEDHYGRSFNDKQAMAPMSYNPTFNELNHQGRRTDYPMEDNWKNGHPSHWSGQRNLSSMNISEPDSRRLIPFSAVNNLLPQIQENPFATGVSSKTVQQEGIPLPRFTVLIQYLYNFHQPLSEEHIEYLKNYILDHWKEFKIKNLYNNWLPRFLECIPRHNGLAIVCEDKPSYGWLLGLKIKGYKGAFFAATDAASPIKRVKLFFQVADGDCTPNEVLSKLHQYNRGHQINFNRFKILSAKKNGGSLHMIVQSDSWTANRLKKRLNCRPLYGNRRIKIIIMGRKRKKPSSLQPPGQIKPKKNEQANELEEFDDMDDDSQSESYDEL